MKQLNKNILTLLLCVIVALSQIILANGQENNTKMNDKSVLVAYFSRVDENYGVGYITKGNTQIIAEMIAVETSGKLFHIETVTSYPKDYKTCIDVARKEKTAKARPEIKEDADVEHYDIIFLGYPNWRGDIPMAVYTFIEKHNWQGKVVIPFCTHEGSGLGTTGQYVKNACNGATVKKGLAIQGSTAQNAQATAKQQVDQWLLNALK